MVTRSFDDYAKEYGLQDMDPSTPQYFTSVIAIAVNEYGLLVHDIARRFGVSRPTIERWLGKENAPHPAMRPQALEWLMQNMHPHTPSISSSRERYDDFGAPVSDETRVPQRSDIGDDIASVLGSER